MEDAINLDHHELGELTDGVENNFFLGEAV
jgi:hypothetical protein